MKLPFPWFPSNLSAIYKLAVQTRWVKPSCKAHLSLITAQRLTAEPACECGLAWRLCLLEICRDVIKTHKVTWLVWRLQGIMQKNVWSGGALAPRKYQRPYHRPLWLSVPGSQQSLPVSVLSGPCVTRIGWPSNRDTDHDCTVCQKSSS